MSIIDKIIASIKSVHGDEFGVYYHDEQTLNLLADDMNFPCAVVQLVELGRLKSESGQMKESVSAVVIFTETTEFDFEAVENEAIIDRCKRLSLAWLNSLPMDAHLTLEAVERTQRVYERFDSVLTGYGVAVRLTENVGEYECDMAERSDIGCIEFMDYDGTILKRISPREALTMAAMPSQPKHDRLLPDGWNWTLQGLKDYIDTYGLNIKGLTIGAFYVTKSGLLEYDLFVTELLEVAIPAYCTDGTTDWGDGTIAMSGTDRYRHTYANAGTYLVKVSGSTYALGFGASSSWTTARFGCDMHVRCPRGFKWKSYQFTNSNALTIAVNSDAGVEMDFYQTRKLKAGVRVRGSSSSNYQNYDMARFSLPEGVTSIGTYAFRYCYSLQSVHIPEGVTSIGNNAFQNCNSLRSVHIPEGVTSIGNNAFQNCNSLRSVHIPEGVTSIGTYAFQSCYSLQSVHIPEGVTSIGNNAFQNCNSLDYLTLPSTLETIGSSNFSGNIRVITCLAEVPPTMASASITNGSLVEIRVPSGSVQAYKEATNWSTYASKIVSI